MTKTGIITGGGKGIGLATLRKLLENKYKVINITRSDNKNLKKLKEIYKNKLNNYFVDLADLKDTKRVSKMIFKNNKIDFLINNAGLRSRYFVDSVSDDIYKNVFNINYHSPMIITTEYIKSIKKEKVKKTSRSIVSLTSIVGPRGFDELSSYAASKGALEYGMRSLSIELAKYNIRINCVAPGFTKTSYFNNFKKNKNKLYQWTLSHIPMNRWADPKEIANIIDFLISDKSSYITGTVIYADGGWTST